MSRRTRYPRLSCHCPSSEHYEVTSLTWTDDATGTQMTKSDHFEYQKSYTATLIFNAEDGYAFGSRDTLRIDYGFGGVYKKLTPDQLTPKSCTVHVTLVCTEGIIESVSMLLNIPHAGYRVPTELEYLQNNCSLVSFRWIDEDTGKALPAGSYFGEKGKRYTAEMVIDAIEGYLFDDYRVNVFENGNHYEVSKDSTFPKRITVRYSYLCTELVTVARAEVTAPVPGAKPDYTVTFPENAGYMLYPESETSVNWIEMNGSSEVKTLSADDTFEAGKKYRLRIWLAPKDETYYLWLSYTYTNGNQGTWIRANGNTGGMAYVFTCEEPVVKHSLTVSIRSFLSETEPITVQLMQKGSVKNTKTCTGARATCAFDSVAEGSYTMRISKKNHVTRDYSVTVSEDTERSAKLNPLGDINGDGQVTNLDFARANSHAKGVVTLTGYELKCADVVKNDGEVTTMDAGRINSHVKGVSKLW